MSAKIPVATRKAVVAALEEGERMVAIAARLKVGERTVRRIAEAVRDDVELAGTPAAGFSAAEVKVLRAFAAQIRVFRCDDCGRDMAVGVGEKKWKCTGCGVGWVDEG